MYRALPFNSSITCVTMLINLSLREFTKIIREKNIKDPYDSIQDNYIERK